MLYCICLPSVVKPGYQSYDESIGKSHLLGLKPTASLADDNWNRGGITAPPLITAMIYLVRLHQWDSRAGQSMSESVMKRGWPADRSAGMQFMYDRKKSEKSRSNRSFAFSGQPFLAALPGGGKVTVLEGWSRNVRVPRGERVMSLGVNFDHLYTTPTKEKLFCCQCFTVVNNDKIKSAIY